MSEIAIPLSRHDDRDLSLVARLDRLYVAVVSDCLDRVGFRGNVMEPHVRPLWPGARMAGYAATVSIVPVDAPPADPADNYKNELAAVDALQPGDVMVVSTCHLSYWGELLSTTAVRRGAHGIVADAYTRDTQAIIDLPFPTFVAGIQAQDSLGRVDVDRFGDPITCAGVAVRTGDLVLADHDGVVVIPIEVAAEVLDAAERKVAMEDEMRADLAAGMSVSAAFQAYGVL
jgi:4-hydroxy-4-methyl-2-oxoglutarate aldolase